MLQEERYEKCCGSLMQLLAGKGEKELNDALNVAVAKVGYFRYGYFTRVVNVRYG